MLPGLRNTNPRSSALQRGPLGIPFGWWLVIVAVYVISPIDALPDFLPAVGWVDDTGMLGFGAYCLFRWLSGRRKAGTDPVAA